MEGGQRGLLALAPLLAGEVGGVQVPLLHGDGTAQDS